MLTRHVIGPRRPEGIFLYIEIMLFASRKLFFSIVNFKLSSDNMHYRKIMKFIVLRASLKMFQFFQKKVDNCV